MTVLPPVLVTAGRFENRWAELVESNGLDISSDAVKLAVTPSDRPRNVPLPDALLDPVDLTRPTTSSVRAAVFVDDTYPPGRWDLWIGVSDTPELPMRYAGTFTTA